MHSAKQKQSTLQNYIGLYTGLVCCSFYSPSMHPTCENITSFHNKLVISMLVWVSYILYNYFFVLVSYFLMASLVWNEVMSPHVMCTLDENTIKCRHIFREQKCFIIISLHCRQFEIRARLTHPLCKRSIQLARFTRTLLIPKKKHGRSQCELSVQIFSKQILQHGCWYYAISRHHMFT